MGTPLYNTDIKTVPNRPELSALDAGDFYLVYDTNTGKISRINKMNANAELEKLANKKSTLSENSEIYYPNQKAVNDGLATKLDVDSSGKITPAGIYLGGASSANLLDDYEEGTWTPSASGDATGALSSSGGKYIKIGRSVTILGYFTVSADFTSILVGGLPFIPTTFGETSMGVSVVITFVNHRIYMTITQSQTTMRFYNGYVNPHYPNTTDEQYEFGITYFTT